MTLRDTLIFLLQNLGFVINFNKSVLDPCHALEFLELEINSLNMRVELPKEKVEKIKKKGQDLSLDQDLSLRDLARLTGRISSTAMAVLPASQQYRDLQQQQITGLSMRGSYEDTIVLHKEAKMELDWWVQNLDLNNRQYILSTAPQIVIQSDASKSGWRAVCQGQSAGGPWSQEERREHMVVLIFAKKLKLESIHLQMDNKVALAYIKK